MSGTASIGSRLVAVDAERGHAEHGEQDQPALLDGKADDAFEHGRSSAQWRVLGAGLAELGLERRSCPRRRSASPGCEAVEDLDALAVGAARSAPAARRSRRAPRGRPRLVVDGLHRVGAHRHRQLGSLRDSVDGHEQARPPGELRIGQRHARLGGAGLLADQRADVGRPCLSTVPSKAVERDGDLLAHAHAAPDPWARSTNSAHTVRQVRDGEDVGVFLHRLAEREVLLDDDAVERRAQLEAVRARRPTPVGADGAQLLRRVVHRDLAPPAGPCVRLQVVLLGRDLVLPQLLLALVGRRAPAPGASAPSAARCAARTSAVLAITASTWPFLTCWPRLAGHALDHARHARHDVGGAVFVEADFAREPAARPGAWPAGGLQRRCRPP